MKKIAIVSKGDSLDSEVDECFGKADKILVIEHDKGSKVLSYKPIDVPYSKKCVGPRLAMKLVNENVEALITQYIGCGAFDTLNDEGIDVYETLQGETVNYVVKLYFAGNLKEITSSQSQGSGRCGGSCGCHKP